MKTYGRSIAAAAICGLALTGLGMPPAHAQSSKPHPFMFFSATKPQDVQIRKGTAEDVRPVVDLFAGTIMAGYCNGWWEIQTINPGGKTSASLVMCKDVQNVDVGKIRFQGQIASGRAFAGAQVTGTSYINRMSLSMSLVADLRVVGRTRHGKTLDVNFQLPMSLYHYTPLSCDGTCGLGRGKLTSPSVRRQSREQVRRCPNCEDGWRKQNCIVCQGSGQSYSSSRSGVCYSCGGKGSSMLRCRYCGGDGWLGD